MPDKLAQDIIIGLRSYISELRRENIKLKGKIEILQELVYKKFRVPRKIVKSTCKCGASIEGPRYRKSCDKCLLIARRNNMKKAREARHEKSVRDNS